MPKSSSLNCVRRPAPPPPPRRPVFSDWSTPGVPDSAWCATDFMLGAGMVIIQPSTEKIVLCYETKKQYWFLPKGRKDVGESLEQAALREAYEESGYRAEFLPLFIAMNQPDPPGVARLHKNSEAIYVDTHAWAPRTDRRGNTRAGGEYLTFWYVGQIPPDAVREEGTGMPDEQNYTSYILTFEEALSKQVSTLEAWVIQYARELFRQTKAMDQQLLEAERKEQLAALSMDTLSITSTSEPGTPSAAQPA